MSGVSSGQWFITADGQVLQTWTPEGGRLKYLRYATTRPVTLDDLYALDEKSAALTAKANKPWAGILGGVRKVRRELEQAFQEAGLEGAAACHTVKLDEAQALIAAEGTIAGRA